MNGIVESHGQVITDDVSTYLSSDPETGVRRYGTVRTDAYGTPLSVVEARHLAALRDRCTDEGVCTDESGALYRPLSAAVAYVKELREERPVALYWG